MVLVKPGACSHAGDGLETGSTGGILVKDSCVYFGGLSCLIVVPGFRVFIEGRCKVAGSKKFGNV